MNSGFARTVCRVLVVCMAVLPFQAGAGMVATGEAAGTPPLPVAARAVLAERMQALGLGADFARDRVAALSDPEVAQLSGQLDSVPAGANGLGIGILLVLIFLLWRFTASDQAQAESGKPGSKPAQKPAAKPEAK